MRRSTIGGRSRRRGSRIHASFDIAQNEFLAGRVSNLDVLTTEQSLVALDAAVASADAAIMQDQIAVFKALGGGWREEASRPSRETAALEAYDFALMLWMLASLFFLWCAFREIRGSILPRPGYDTPAPITKSYLASCCRLRVIFAYPPFTPGTFSGSCRERPPSWPTTTVRSFIATRRSIPWSIPTCCYAGHANPRTGKIGIQAPWCDILAAYLRHPGPRKPDESSTAWIFLPTRACTSAVR